MKTKTSAIEKDKIKKLTKIRLINASLFFFFLVIALLMGAAKPLTVHFLWSLPIVAAMDFVQDFYLKWLFGKMLAQQKRLLWKHILFFLIAGLVVSLAFLLFFSQQQIAPMYYAAFSLFLCLISVFYSALLYVFNKQMLEWFQVI